MYIFLDFFLTIDGSCFWTEIETPYKFLSEKYYYRIFLHRFTHDYVIIEYYIISKILSQSVWQNRQKARENETLWLAQT